MNAVIIHNTLYNVVSFDFNLSADEQSGGQTK